MNSLLLKKMFSTIKEILIKETLINSANEMKHEAHGTQQPRHINMIGEGVSTAQRSDSLVQLINQHFLKLISFWVRQAHHEHNQGIPVRSEPVEELNPNSFLKASQFAFPGN